MYTRACTQVCTANALQALTAHYKFSHEFFMYTVQAVVIRE